MRLFLDCEFTELSAEAKLVSWGSEFDLHSQLTLKPGPLQTGWKLSDRHGLQ